MEDHIGIIWGFMSLYCDVYRDMIRLYIVQILEKKMETTINPYEGLVFKCILA